MSDVMPIFKVLRLVRDSRSTRNADRALLNALALRCKPDKKFVCWPSYRLLAQDTLLDEVTLKRASKRLEDAQLIKRVIRPNRSNLFFLNVSKLIEQAAEVEAAKKAAAPAVEESPFEDVSVISDDNEAADNGDDDNGYDDDGFGGGSR